MDEFGFDCMKPTVRLADAPPREGTQLEFRLMGEWTEVETGEVRKLHKRVVTRSFSH